MIPKVSICIPTYKQLTFLAQTLNSIIEQDYTNYEIVISDDTPDNSVLLLLKKYNFECNVKYHKNEATLGSPRNWNKAVSLASGQYIKVLHHDDYFSYPFSLRKFVEMLDDNPKSDFAFSSAIAIDMSNSRTWIHKPSKKQLQALLHNPLAPFFGNFIGPPSSTIYRNTKKIQYDQNLKWVVDLDFYIQVLKNNNHYQYSDQSLITSISGAAHNVTNDCINNKETELREYLYLYKKNYTWKMLYNYNIIFLFMRLFKRYNISSELEIKKLNINTPLTLQIKLILFIRSILNVL